MSDTEKILYDIGEAIINARKTTTDSQWQAREDFKERFARRGPMIYAARYRGDIEEFGKLYDLLQPASGPAVEQARKRISELIAGSMVEVERFGKIVAVMNDLFPTDEVSELEKVVEECRQKAAPYLPKSF